MHVLSFPHNHRFPVIITDDYSSLHYSNYGICVQVIMKF